VISKPESHALVQTLITNHGSCPL